MRERRLRVLDDLRAVEIFVSIVETGSITRAARRLGVLPSTVSKKLAEMERRARARLLHRTTRRISITDIGQRFYDQCLGLLDQADRAEGQLHDEVRDPSGRLSFTAPVVFAQRQIAPLLPGFVARYPAIELDLLASARTVNLVEEGLDLSLRLVRADQIPAGGRLLAPNRRAFCAAPGYLARHGTPSHPSELVDHSCLLATSRPRNDAWRYRDGESVELVRVAGPLVSDDASTIEQAAVAGVGIALLGTFAIGDDLRRGTLVEVLREYVVQDSALVALASERGFVPARVSLLLDYLAAGFGQPPVWDRDLA